MVNALELPEIRFRIGWYLDSIQALSCSQICRSFYTSFAPLVWQDLHFGSPTHPRPELEHNLTKRPLARSLSFDHTSGIHNQHSPEDLLHVLQGKVGWIRSLSIHSHESIHQFSLGAGCNRLESITLEALPFDDVFDQKYWKNCRMLIKQNRATLQSLSLLHWKFQSFKPVPGQPQWNPILSCTEHMQLRSLSLVKCRIRGRHLDAFWTICQRIENLELEEVDIDLSLPPSFTTSNINKGNNDSGAGAHDTLCFPTATSSQSNSTLSISSSPSPSSTPSRFPRLRALTLRKLRRASPLRQLQLIISQCPALQNLTWSIGWYRHFPCTQFCDLLAASTNPWPDLTSIVVRDHSNQIPITDRARLLELVSKRAHCQLDVG
ncbi:hypothetical protein BGZ51_003043 [Haplosporangium sp. Z 767]|nr:hypothetical protein BGZ50_005637 [Haplosporangium sp. Z 11]KAF9184920.1 hypothetical protein BGZ51_003043 [Haplosporangium sp. Z 767]